MVLIVIYSLKFLFLLFAFFTFANSYTISLKCNFKLFIVWEEFYGTQFKDCTGIA